MTLQFFPFHPLFLSPPLHLSFLLHSRQSLPTFLSLSHQLLTAFPNDNCKDIFLITKSVINNQVLEKKANIRTNWPNDLLVLLLLNGDFFSVYPLQPHHFRNFLTHSSNNPAVLPFDIRHRHIRLVKIQSTDTLNLKRRKGAIKSCLLGDLGSSVCINAKKKKKKRNKEKQVMNPHFKRFSRFTVFNICKICGSRNNIDGKNESKKHTGKTE